MIDISTLFPDGVVTPEQRDYVDMREQETKLPPISLTEKQWYDKYTGMHIKNPVHLLSIFDESIRTGRVKLYPWQVVIMKQFAEGKVPEQVLRMALVANNTSGKSQYVIAPCSVWMAMAFTMSRCVITSSSGTQLDRQTGHAILLLCKRINEAMGQIVWKCNYRYFTFLPTGSTIEMYATDDEGKAEGYHRHIPDGEFAIFVDEGKSVAEKIYTAIDRCNDVTRRVDVSSPGNPSGTFYSRFSSAYWYGYKVTYHDCPHISPDAVAEAKERYGENSPYFRSAYLAEFTSINEEVIISHEDIQKCIVSTVDWILEDEAYAGLDLSLGGDETVFTVFRGNKQTHMECFKIADAPTLVERIKWLINRHNVTPENVNADDGGIGKPIIDMLWRDGYHVRRVRNESTAFDKTTFANRGAEMWYNFGRFVKECSVMLLSDNTLISQLSSRYYSRGDVHGKIILESKNLARARGHGSPDRADAVVLAFANRRFPLQPRGDSAIGGKPARRPMGIEEVIEAYRQQKCAHSGFDRALLGTRESELSGRPIYGDYTCADN